jgi:mannitol/fructose-specific phosphotransferase system IIA component (Ntr-type)
LVGCTIYVLKSADQTKVLSKIGERFQKPKDLTALKSYKDEKINSKKPLPKDTMDHCSLVF